MHESTRATIEAVERFNEAFNRHDVDAVMAAMTHDCVFESTAPPEGERYEGADAVRAVWEEFFAGNPTARFEAEEVVACSDRATVRWRYHFDGGHVRGIDLFTVRDAGWRRSSPTSRGDPALSRE